MLSTGFEPAIPASERPQTHALRPRGHRDQPFTLSKPQLIVLLSCTFLFYCHWLSASYLQFDCTCDQQYTSTTQWHFTGIQHCDFLL